jgi:hypothetical protein
LLRQANEQSTKGGVELKNKTDYVFI